MNNTSSPPGSTSRSRHAGARHGSPPPSDSAEQAPGSWSWCPLPLGVGGHMAWVRRSTALVLQSSPGVATTSTGRDDRHAGAGAERPTSPHHPRHCPHSSGAGADMDGSEWPADDGSAAASAAAQRQPTQLRSGRHWPLRQDVACLPPALAVAADEHLLWRLVAVLPGGTEAVSGSDMPPEAWLAVAPALAWTRETAVALVRTLHSVLLRLPPRPRAAWLAWLLSRLVPALEGVWRAPPGTVLPSKLRQLLALAALGLRWLAASGVPQPQPAVTPSTTLTAAVAAWQEPPAFRPPALPLEAAVARQLEVLLHAPATNRPLAPQWWRAAAATLPDVALPPCASPPAVLQPPPHEAAGAAAAPRTSPVAAVMWRLPAGPGPGTGTGTGTGNGTVASPPSAAPHPVGLVTQHCWAALTCVPPDPAALRAALHAAVELMELAQAGQVAVAVGAPAWLAGLLSSLHMTLHEPGAELVLRQQLQDAACLLAGALWLAPLAARPPTRRLQHVEASVVAHMEALRQQLLPPRALAALLEALLLPEASGTDEAPVPAGRAAGSNSNSNSNSNSHSNSNSNSHSNSNSNRGVEEPWQDPEATQATLLEECGGGGGGGDTDDDGDEPCVDGPQTAMTGRLRRYSTSSMEDEEGHGGGGWAVEATLRSMLDAGAVERVGGGGSGSGSNAATTATPLAMLELLRSCGPLHLADTQWLLLHWEDLRVVVTAATTKQPLARLLPWLWSSWLAVVPPPPPSRNSHIQPLSLRVGRRGRSGAAPAAGTGAGPNADPDAAAYAGAGADADADTDVDAGSEAAGDSGGGPAAPTDSWHSWLQPVTLELLEGCRAAASELEAAVPAQLPASDVLTWLAAVVATGCSGQESQLQWAARWQAALHLSPERWTAWCRAGVRAALLRGAPLAQVTLPEAAWQPSIHGSGAAALAHACLQAERCEAWHGPNHPATGRTGLTGPTSSRANLAPSTNSPARLLLPPTPGSARQRLLHRMQLAGWAGSDSATAPAGGRASGGGSSGRHPDQGESRGEGGKRTRAAGGNGRAHQAGAGRGRAKGKAKGKGKAGSRGVAAGTAGSQPEEHHLLAVGDVLAAAHSEPLEAQRRLHTGATAFIPTVGTLVVVARLPAGKSLLRIPLAAQSRELLAQCAELPGAEAIMQQLVARGRLGTTTGVPSALTDLPRVLQDTIWRHRPAASGSP